VPHPMERDARQEIQSTPDRFHILWNNLAVQDLLVLSFQAYMVARAWAAQPGPDDRTALLATSALLAFTVVMLTIARGSYLPRGFRRSLAYRLGLFVPLVCSYLVLRPCLQALHPQLLDARLYHIDRALFGDTPALLLDRFVTPGRVEWFAFFYYAYFPIVASYEIGTLVFDSGRRQYELLLGSAIVVALGHALYTVVPGLGPHAYCAHSFRHALVGGPWWGRVETAVRAEGAMLDIFPSLHTALPVLFLLHSFRHRRRAPFRQLWAPMIFVVGNIIIATVFLRWHYAVDLLAGALLAFLAQRVAMATWSFEHDRGAARQAVWEPLAPIGMQTRDFNLIAALFLIHAAALVLAAGASPG